MDTALIFGLIQKGLALLPILLQAGEDVAQTISNMKKLADSGTAGTPISDDDLTAIEAQFDADLASFNEPMED